jgi:chromosome segregation ATPase
MADIEQKLKIMAKEIEDKETAVREVSAQLEKVHAEFADKQKECQGLEKKLVDSCYPKLQQLEQDNAFLKAMTQRQDKENRKMLEQLKEAEKKLESSSGDSGSDHAELNKLRSDKSRLLADLEDLKLKYDVSSADFQKFEMLRDELEGTKEGLRRLKQEKRIIADRLQSAEQNNEALLQQYKKTQQMFQQEFKARAGLTGITGMVSRERGLILPNESHAYGNPFMISVQDGLKNTEAHDDTVRRNTHTHTHTQYILVYICTCVCL